MESFVEMPPEVKGISSPRIVDGCSGPSGMKLWLVYDYFIEECSHLGIYDTYEKAKEVADRVIGSVMEFNLNAFKEDK
jgi:hypothetical protein